MSAKDKLEGARNAFTFYYAFQNAVGQEIGMDRAVALAGQVDEMMGAEQGRQMKKQAGRKQIDLKTATTMALDLIGNGFGFKSKVVEESPRRMVFRCDRCPIYEASEEIGLDSATIHSQCMAGPIKYMDAMVKQLNPKLSFRLKTFRSSADGHCEEMMEMS